MDLFRPYYQAARRAGFDPLVIDEMELWQIGATFTLTDDEEEALEEARQQDAKSGKPRRTGKKRRNLIEERIAYAEGRGPKPEPDPPDPSVMMFIQRATELKDNG